MARDLNRRLFLDYLLGKRFILHHDLVRSKTSIISSDDIVGINKSGIGLNVDSGREICDIDSEFLCIPIAIFAPKEQRGPTLYPFDSMYKIFAGTETDIFTSFCPVSVDEIADFKHEAEDKISKIEVRLSHSLSYKEIGQNISTATDSYYQSYEKKLLEMILDNINDILLSKCAAYKVIFFARLSDGGEDVVRYLKSNSVILGTKRLKATNLLDLNNHAKKMKSIPLSYANASQAIGLSDRVTHMSRIRTGEILSSGDILVGKYIDCGISEIEDTVSISSKVLNLGTLVTGLPGTGKTKLTQSIMEQALALGSRVAIVSPTGEWNGFGRKNTLRVLKLGNSNQRINFFKCEVPNTRKFYENLAMLVAVGCNSGPYKNSVEKCLLSAFSKAYSRTKDCLLLDIRNP